MYSGLYPRYINNESELHAACRSGTLRDVLKCLESLEPNIQWYHDGQTPLHVAILSGRKDTCDVIKAVLGYGADINAQTSTEGNTALHLAVLHCVAPGKLDIIMYLLERKVDLTIRNKTLRTAYDCAIASGQYELAATLNNSVMPEKTVQSYKKKIGHKYGPYIIESVLASQEESLKKFIELGGDPNTVNKYHAGAIHYAVTHSSLPVYDTLAILIQAGADPNLTNEENDTALNLVIKSQSLRESGQMTRCVHLLVSSGAEATIQNWDNKDAITLASDKGYTDVLKILRKKTPKSQKEDVNSPNADGVYPIHEAALLENSPKRHTKINSLIAKGAEVNKQIATTGNTSLHLCAEKDYGDTAVVLLSHHIDYTIKNTKDKTAYELAKEMGHESVAAAIQKKQDGSKEKTKKKTTFCVIL